MSSLTSAILRAEKYGPANYIQHSAHIEPGRDGLFNLVLCWFAWYTTSVFIWKTAKLSN
jgi:predicted SnoaL-like aldol condensation-catalyzing enzyme